MVRPNTSKTSFMSRCVTRVAATVLLTILLQAASAQSAYVKKYKPTADSLSKEYGIPASIILGVAIIESGSGTSRNAKRLNNHFGIAGKNKLSKTKGKSSRYKQYHTVMDSYVDFCKMLTRKKYYKALKGTKDHKPWIEAMAKAHYSELPIEWKKRINATIKSNKLSATH